MRPLRYLVFALFVTVAGLSLAAPARSAGMQLSDLQRIVSLSDPQISPDGKLIALIVSTPDWKTDTNKGEINLVNTATGERRVLTSNRTDLGTLQWSPDGTRLAFLAEDPRTGEPQIFVMPMDGGDSVRITDNEQGIDTYSWSPDGKQIAFIAQDPPLNEAAIKQHNKVFQVTDGNSLLTQDVAPWQLWVVGAKGGPAKQLTEGKFSLDTLNSGGATPPAWSADGEYLAFTKFPGPYWGPSFHSVIAEVGVASGKMRTLVPAETSADFSFAPASDNYAFMRPRGGDQNNGNAVYVSSGGKFHDATAALARNFNAYAWLPDGKALLLQGDLGTRSVFWVQPVDGKARVLDLGDVYTSYGLSVDAAYAMSVSRTGAIAFVGSTGTHPEELYVLDSVDSRPRRLTDLNAFADALSLGRTVAVEWRGLGGFHEDGVLTYPVDFQPGHKYPLVIELHGGPMGAATLRFSALPQLFAAAGFLTLQPNYRGSNNLGDRYQHAVYRDTGEGPGEDVMAGIAAVEKLGIVDHNRIGVGGWSYGGYMTAWLTSRYHLWKAAVAGAPLTDWVMDWTISFYQKGDEYFFGSSPWTDAGWNIWREQSPITHVRNVNTPTLLMSDVGDANVPFVNADAWYHALRDNGVPVEFYAYPLSVHFPDDIVQRTDAYRRWVGWMEKYLK